MPRSNFPHDLRRLSPEARKAVLCLLGGGVLLACFVLQGTEDGEAAASRGELRDVGRTAGAATSQVEDADSVSGFPVPERSGLRYGLLNDVTDALSGNSDNEADLVFLRTTGEERLFESWRREIADAGSVSLVLDREDERGVREFLLEAGDRPLGRVRISRDRTRWTIVGVEPYSTQKERDERDRIYQSMLANGELLR